MYKVILVDDEFWICQGLQMMVDWASLDMKVVASTDNTLMALQLCKQEMPDIIITDINMPKMDGLEMIAYLRELCPNAVVIIISGHDEFSYAQKAVTLHAFDYMLKPIDLEDLMGVLRRAREQLEERSSNRQVQEEKDALMESSRQVLVDWLVNRVLSGLLRQEQLTPMQADVLRSIELLYNCAILLEIDHHESSGAVLLSNYEQYMVNLQTIVTQYTHMVLLPQNYDAYRTSFLICMFYEDRSILETKRNTFIIQLQEMMKKDSQSGTIGYGEIQSSIYAIRESAKQAAIAVQKKFIYGKNQVFPYQSPKERDEKGVFRALEDIQYAELAENVIFNEPIDFDAFFENIRSLVKMVEEDSYTYLHGIVQNLEFRLLEELNKLPFGAEFQFNPFSKIHEITRSGTLDDVLRALRTQLEDLSAKIAKRQENETNVYINKAIHYLNGHYKESDLNLKTMAKVANMSVSYFCSRFKIVTGSSCIAYLVGIRMKKAKELLRDTDMRIHEIAAAVGYINPTYFCTSFKSNVGCTPESYRKQWRKEQKEEEDMPQETTD